MRRHIGIGLILGLGCLSMVCAPHADALQKGKSKSKKTTASAPAKGGRAGALALVDAFEKAYQRKDKNTMILKLMAPTNEKGVLNKRYQWLRGYGIDEQPGAVRPPILFTTRPGSYVPTQYKLLGDKAAGSGRWEVTVEEQGTCLEETGKWKVVRKRTFKLTQVNGKWYVLDYIMVENPEEYGFWSDDIYDKMTLIGK